jgi:hypothetical protein
MRRRELSRRRPQSPRRTRPTILIVCGGVRTEPLYLRGLRTHANNASVDVTIVSRAKSPAQIVDFAIRHRGRVSVDFDEVWCVLDVDEFDLAPAEQLARSGGVRLAISNPCFELWLLLHHVDCRALCDGYQEVVRLLKRHVPGYDKSRLEFGDYAPGVPDVVKRARELNPGGEDHQRNPSTSVWRLAEVIMGES